MSVKKMTEKKDYIDVPAGVEDSIELNAIQMNQIFKGEGEKATSKNSETSAKKPTQRDMVYSNQLEEGMTIKAEKGGNPKSRDGESR